MDVAIEARDWQLVAEIAEKKAANLDQLVKWWRANVSVRESPGGRDRASNADLRSMVSVEAAEEMIGFSQQQISRIGKKITDLGAYCESIVDAAKKKALAVSREEGTHQAYASGVEDWYTPSEIIEAARLTLGEIELDPASSLTAQKTVKAKAFYTAKDNGLAQTWSGRVWLNPPYRQPLVQQFVEKLVSSFDCLDEGVESAVLLTNNSTDTEWFQLAASRACGLGFTWKRTRFHDADGNVQGTPLQGQAIFYFGREIELFRSSFSRILWFFPWCTK